MSRNEKSPVDWSAEFNAFAGAPELSPPPGLSEKVVTTIEGELNPAAWRVFSKLGFIQVLLGGLVLLFCPQFGINLFPGMGLMTLFMRFGEKACMMGCGSVFLGASGLAAALILRPEEIRVIRRSRSLQLGLMALVSSGVFVCLGDELVLTMGVAWVLGSVLGGLGSLELGWLLRSRVKI